MSSEYRLWDPFFQEYTQGPCYVSHGLIFQVYYEDFEDTWLTEGWGWIGN